MAREVDRMCFTEPEVEEDGEVELSLGLSIGGGCRKAATGGGSLRASGFAAVSGDADLDLGGGDTSLAKPGAVSFFLAAGGEAQRSRELQALRRKEARRKREEKQKRKVIGHEGSGVLPGCGGPATACSEEDRMALQAQELESRAKDRKAREDEASWAVGWSHGQKCRVTDSQIPEIVGVQNPNPNPAPQPFPVVQMRQPCFQVQYVPVVNGFGIPCTMPCWVPAISPATAHSSTLPERNVYQPVACRLPAPARQPMGCYPELKIKLAPLSADSPASSSSGISDHQTTASLQEGKSSSSSSSSDGGAKSHSSHTLAEDPRPQASSQASNPQGNSGQCVSRHPVSKAIEEGTDKLVSSTPHSSLVSNSDAGAPTQGKLEGSASVNKPNPEDPRTGPSPLLPRMPCVATTGDGPDGRTITGFLYRYTRSEVSIVCVCHRSSFSPAGFVEHAGGTDISHPLRQIIVVHS